MVARTSRGSRWDDDIGALRATSRPLIKKGLKGWIWHVDVKGWGREGSGLANTLVRSPDEWIHRVQCQVHITQPRVILHPDMR